MTALLIDELTETSHSAARMVHLSAREREVAVLIARGLSNTEISEELWLSLPTVKTHVASILAKLDVPTRVHVVVAAYESGLVRVGQLS